MRIWVQSALSIDINRTRQDPEEAVRDFRDRIRNYEKVYQTIDESEKHYSYIKITDIG